MTNNRKITSAEKIANQIQKKIENGVTPWDKPWNGKFARLGENKGLTSGKAYRGINAFLTYGEYKSPNWITFNQAKKKNWKLRKGEKGTIVVFWKNIKKESDEEKEDGEKKMINIPIMRHYVVFNLDQFENAVCPDTKDQEETVLDFEPIEKAKEILKSYKNAPEVKYSGIKAFYRPSQDFIGMPKKEDFKTVEGFYATLFHEMVHSTGHESRLKRDMKGIGNHKQYSKEELVAELGAAMLCAMAGFSGDVIDNQASYVGSWLKALGNNPSEIITASQKAQKAVDMILGKKTDYSKNKK